MTQNAKNTIANVIPAIRYRDAAAAIEWLCSALGFEKKLVVPGEGNQIRHSQLVFGNGMIMVGSARDDEFDTYMKSPAALGGVGSQGAVLIVEDADAHHARAVEAGAEIIREIIDEQPQGGRGYTCRDPEGHVWHIGTYDPWAPVSLSWQPSAT